MDDERMQPGRHEPLWPADDEPTQPPRRPTASPSPTPPAPPLWPAPSISEEQTARVPTFPPAPAPAAYDVSGAPTAAIPTPPARPIPALNDTVNGADNDAVSDAPTMRISAAPVAPMPPVAPMSPISPISPAPPRPAARLAEPPPLPAPLRPPTPQRPMSRPEAALAWARDHWPLVTSAAIVLIAVIAGLSIYNYASSLAAQPQKIVSRYCDALTHADYKTAYSLLAPALQAQTTQAQYVADGAARDTISGRVTACAGAQAQRLSALSFLSNPRSTLINLTLTRGASAQGQIALSRDATGWHVAGLSAAIEGIDLGPLHTEQALCAAFMGRDYSAAYGLLSAPFQHEQGSEQAFTKDFGANLAITGCEPALSGYTLDKADQRASFQVTLDVSVSGGSSATKLTLPAKIALVREQAGWRVDSITPTLGQ